MPLASAAVAVMEMEVPAVTCALFAGAVIDTVGDVLPVTVIVTAVEVAVAFSLSVTLTVKV